jgi:hypothetical protein
MTYTHPHSFPRARRAGRLVLALSAALLALPLGGSSAAAAPSDEPTPEAAGEPTPSPTVAAPPPARRPAGGTTVAPVRPQRVPVLDRGAIELGQPRARQGRWKGFPISLSLRDAPLPEVLRSFARIAGINVVLDPGVEGEVTVELKDVPWDQALYVILKSHGMAAEIDGTVWVVRPR